MEDNMNRPFSRASAKRKQDHIDTMENEDKSPKRMNLTSWDTRIVPKFDPDKKTTNAEDWLSKIDQLGDMYAWEERERIFVMMLRINGAARVWYEAQNDYTRTWAQWKQDLKNEFPRSDEFSDLLQEMLARNKDSRETMTMYFHDKMSLINKCGLKGKQAVSCVISGLPGNLRANARVFGFKTPQDLYNGFLSNFEGGNTGEQMEKEDNPTQQPDEERGDEGMECRFECCQTCPDRTTPRQDDAAAATSSVSRNAETQTDPTKVNDNVAAPQVAEVNIPYDYNAYAFQPIAFTDESIQQNLIVFDLIAREQINEELLKQMQ